MIDWKDATVVLILVLVVLGAVSLSVSAQSFTIVRGKIVEMGAVAPEENRQPMRTITVLIENDDRVFRIDRGTAVKYAISDRDAELLAVGSHVQLLVTSYSDEVRVITVTGGPDL
ncbi:MAG: hypothetical protein ACREAQ_06710 [Nitrososphaera sp.]